MSEKTQGNNKWTMVIDLDKCTGCQACVVACHAENNMPTVGPELVAMGRSQHWIRIERYWDGEYPDVKARFIPLLCQQCGHAPCEPVCPVFAAASQRRGGPQPPGLQPLHRHALLRQQLPLLGPRLQLVRSVHPGAAE